MLFLYNLYYLYILYNNYNLLSLFKLYKCFPIDVTNISNKMILLFFAKSNYYKNRVKYSPSSKTEIKIKK